MSPLLVIKVVIAETSGAHYGEQILKFIQSHNYQMTFLMAFLNIPQIVFLPF